MHQRTARQLVLSAAAVYLVLVGYAELGRRLGVVETFAADDAIRAATTAAGLAVGSIFGFDCPPHNPRSAPRAFLIDPDEQSVWKTVLKSRLRTEESL